LTDHEIFALSLTVPRADSERVLAELIELFPQGCQENEPDPDSTEFVLYGERQDLPDVDYLIESLGLKREKVSLVKVEEDWTQEWRRFHRPVVVSGKSGSIWVGPPWESSGRKELAAQGGIEIVIDPGQAFGTGAHATTKLCLQLLLDLESPAADSSLADWGCGSGVLAIAAAKLGYSQVFACDFDPLATAATAQNCLENGVVNVEVSELDLEQELGPTADIVVANLLGPLLLTVSSKLTTLPKTLIISGILRSEADSLSEAFTSMRLQEERRITESEWAAIQFSSR
jgi:ribosomal protein L11 methyltransferase